MTTLGAIAAAGLEDWLRDRYFHARIDISSSGMANYSLADLRRLLEIGSDELDAIVFRDSPSLGCKGLRAAIAARYAAGDSDRVLVGHGSSETLFLAIAALIQPGDEIVVVDPAYQSLTAIAAALGARLVPWRLRSTEQFRPDLEDLRGLLTTRTRMVVANFPHNPTGATLGAADFAGLLALVESAGCVLLWDGAFSEIAYTNERPPLALPTHPSVLAFGTLSKAYGLPGLRVGWCLGDPRVLREMIRIRDYVTLNTSPLNEFLAQRVIEQADRVIAPLLDTARRNRLVVAEWAAAHPGLIDLPLPAGGVSAFPRIVGAADVTADCERLVRERGVLVVPGACFGNPDRFRLGFGGDTDELRKGLAHVAAVLGQR